VNLAAGKNLVGSFHHPLAVLADTDVLTTLPKAELRAGLQESVRLGLFATRSCLAYLEKNADSVMSGDAKALARVVTASVRVKADVVANDERESGLRMILNYGHTLGHAIERRRDTNSYSTRRGGLGEHCGDSAGADARDDHGARAERMIALILRYGPLSSFKASARTDW
jgi:3-dehydroquinate synthase